MYILLDIGGTKTRIAGSTDLESIGEPVIIETPKNFEEGIALIVDQAREVVKGEIIEGVALGVAASPNREKTMLVGGGPNIMDWADKPLKENLEEAFGVPVDIENDTAMGGLAQVMYGPAKGHEIAVYVTISTGVGGCRFVDGKIDKSARGFEPGWLIVGSPDVCGINSNGFLSGYCSKGYLMSHIGGTCVEKETGKKPYDTTNSAFWEAKAKILAQGLHNITTLWSPDIIVLGGSMMNKIGIPIESVREHLDETLKDVFTQSPIIERAKFGDDMGLYGAMAYLRQKMHIYKNPGM